MKINLALILSVILGVGIVASVFTVVQISNERDTLRNDLELRVDRTTDDLVGRDLISFITESPGDAEHRIDSLCNKYELAGIAVYFGNDSIIFNKAGKAFLNQTLPQVGSVLSTGVARGHFTRIGKTHLFSYIRRLRPDKDSEAALLVFADAGYIQSTIERIWLRNFLRWFVQALLISSFTLLIIRWGILRPIQKVVDWIRSVRFGNADQLQQDPPRSGFLGPLYTEIAHIAREMTEAKAIAEEEARLRTSSEAIWTPERLKVEVTNLLRDRKMIIVSNREPYMHLHDGKDIKCIVPASGLITAMEPILKACGGLWIASGTGDADKEMVDSNDKLPVPPESPQYTLRRIWLTKEDEDHFYYGFSNEGLWPLCHIAHTRPIFRREDWDYFKKVNEKYAKAVIQETAGDDHPFILIQDYHFALLPGLIRKEKPEAHIAIFWHIPWPNPESFGICPWQTDILRGMLGANLIGFHTQYHCNHFLETVNRVLESRVLYDNYSVKMAGKTTFVKPFPISIAFTLKDLDNNGQKIKIPDLLRIHGVKATHMGIGVDRIDYTKGILEKFLAIERFLDKYQSYRGRFTFVQIGAPSRTFIKSYSDTILAVEKEAERINQRFKSKNWKPIIFLKRHHSHQEIAPYYASANFCMVSSLHDGMNLVSKEFIAARNFNDGVLILSRFAGASQELTGALVINPYDIEKTADAIKTALEMPHEEQRRRMKSMRQRIVEHNIYSWAADIIRNMASIQG
ncbi:MAG: trehalose-6-phosphate synthase [Bacteroidales bacterium]